MKSSFLPSILLEILKVESVNIETPSTPDGLSTPIYLFIFSLALRGIWRHMAHLWSKH